MMRFHLPSRIPRSRYPHKTPVPLLGFGYSLAKGVARAVAESGLIGVFTGGVTGAAGGIAAAITFGCLFALLSRPQSKS